VGEIANSSSSRARRAVHSECVADGQGRETTWSRRVSTAALRCVECGVESPIGARGWRGCRIDEPELDEPPALAFFCPDCAGREFGPARP